MRTLIILILIIFSLSYLVNYLSTSGKLDEFFDNHSDLNWVPGVEFYIATFSNLFGKYDSALYRFQRIVEKYPKTEYAPSAQYNIARIYDSKGEKEKAIKEYEKLLNNFPNCQYTEISIKRINFLR